MVITGTGDAESMLRFVLRLEAVLGLALGVTPTLENCVPFAVADEPTPAELGRVDLLRSNERECDSISAIKLLAVGDTALIVSR